MFTLTIRVYSFMGTLWCLSSSSFGLSSGEGACWVVLLSVLLGLSRPASCQGAGLHVTDFLGFCSLEIFVLWPLFAAFQRVRAKNPSASQSLPQRGTLECSPLDGPEQTDSSCANSTEQHSLLQGVHTPSHHLIAHPRPLLLSAPLHH